MSFEQYLRCGLLLLPALLVAGLSIAIAWQRPGDRLYPADRSGFEPVDWGTDEIQGVQMQVIQPSGFLYFLPLVDVVKVIGATFAYAPTDHVRVTLVSGDEIVVSDCGLDTFPPGCGVGDFFDRATEILAGLGILPWNNFIKVVSYSHACTRVVVVGTRHVTHIRDHVLSAALDWTWLSLFGPVPFPDISTCQTKDEIKLAVNGIYH
jgi:hypothetical protein